MCIRDSYIYLRASNLAGKDQKGRFYLYWAKASLLLYPNFWKDQVIKTQNGQDYYEFSVTKEGKVDVYKRQVLPCSNTYDQLF